jgi:hypothetical protein
MRSRPTQTPKQRLGVADPGRTRGTRQQGRGTRQQGHRHKAFRLSADCASPPHPCLHQPQPRPHLPPPARSRSGTLRLNRFRRGTPWKKAPAAHESLEYRPVERDVLVDKSRRREDEPRSALNPTTTRNRRENLRVTGGACDVGTTSRLDPQIRRGWLAAVEMPASSPNGRSRLAMQLRLPPEALTADFSSQNQARGEYSRVGIRALHQ